MLVVLLFVVVATGVLSIANTQRHHIVGRLHTHTYAYTNTHRGALLAATLPFTLSINQRQRGC